jgi:hypothetical protein
LIREAQKHVDPDPERCFKQFSSTYPVMVANLILRFSKFEQSAIGPPHIEMMPNLFVNEDKSVVQQTHITR